MLGIGQIIRPLVGGEIADRFGTADAVIAGASALGVAAIAAAFYRRPKTEPALANSYAQSDSEPFAAAENS